MTEAQGDEVIALLIELTNQGDLIVTGLLWTGAAGWSLFGFACYWFFLWCIRRKDVL